MKKSSRREHIKYMFLINFLNFTFIWRIIALQYLFDICHTSTWISHGCRDVLSLLNHPPTSHPFPLLWVVTEPQLYLKFAKKQASYEIFLPQNNDDGDDKGGGRKLWEVMDMFWGVDGGNAFAVYIYPQTHSVVHKKYVELFTYWSYLNKVFLFFFKENKKITWLNLWIHLKFHQQTSSSNFLVKNPQILYFSTH